MINHQLIESINEILSSTLGLDTEDIKAPDHFQLDYNATLDDLQNLHDELEAQLDITLPPFTAEGPLTVEDLYNLVDDSSL